MFQWRTFRRLIRSLTSSFTRQLMSFIIAEGRQLASASGRAATIFLMLTIACERRSHGRAKPGVELFR
jgi:hypothetical protein